MHLEVGTNKKPPTDWGGSPHLEVGTNKKPPTDWGGSPHLEVGANKKPPWYTVQETVLYFTALHYCTIQ